VRSLGLAGRAEIRQGKVLATIDRVIDPNTASIVFLDPPYEMEQEYELVLDKLAAVLAERSATSATNDVPPGLVPGRMPGLIIVQHSTRLDLKKGYGVLHRTRILKQGDNALSFYEPESLIADSPTPTS
jgi:16S rRNA G966 N2-methylase RsmD